MISPAVVGHSLEAEREVGTLVPGMDRGGSQRNLAGGGRSSQDGEALSRTRGELRGVKSSWELLP